MINVVKMPVNGHGFEEFWDIYPRHVKKMATKALWDKITTNGKQTRTKINDSGTFESIFVKGTAEEIIEGAKRFRKSWIDPQTYKLKDEGRFIPYPTTWLNGGGWEDS